MKNKRLCFHSVDELVRFSGYSLSCLQDLCSEWLVDYFELCCELRRSDIIISCSERTRVEEIRRSVISLLMLKP
ncbi:hypothetical protein [Dipodfec virus UOA04_Rod_495]|nr:hypothetical protein [Dipodfec virus UOA04_Rod_495]